MLFGNDGIIIHPDKRTSSQRGFGASKVSSGMTHKHILNGFKYANSLLGHTEMIRGVQEGLEV